MPESPEKLNVFISYAQEDVYYLNKLKVYLHEETCPDLNVWYDGEIKPGGEWDEAIKKHLEESHIILLLISQHFLISDYIKKVELKTALQKHEHKQCKIIPIFTKPCDLNRFPQITKLQGMPKGMRFLSNLTNELDGELAQIQKEINETASTELNIRESNKPKDEDNKKKGEANEKKSEKANKIEVLRRKQKIFLSIPQSHEGKEKRFDLIIQAEGKKRHKNWPYEIVPGINEAEEMEKMGDEERIKMLSSLINESIYSIHIVETENDLTEGSFKVQYDLVKAAFPDSSKDFYKTIIWALSSDLRGKIDTTFSMNNSIISEGYGALFAEIARFDEDKDKLMNKLMQEFFPQKRIYMYYEFATDHENELRIELKTKIEGRNYSVRVNTPDDDVKNEKEDLGSCDGAFVFYGKVGPKWFMMKQANLLQAKNLLSRGVCVDEPEIQTKCQRDVSILEFVTIQGKEQLDAGLETFLEALK